MRPILPVVRLLHSHVDPNRPFAVGFAPGDDATAFRSLNEEWIRRYFTLEVKDRETWNDPVHSVLLKDGHIFMAYAAPEAVGCVALIPMREGVYELPGWRFFASARQEAHLSAGNHRGGAPLRMTSIVWTKAESQANLELRTSKHCGTVSSKALFLYC